MVEHFTCNAHFGFLRKMARLGIFNIIAGQTRYFASTTVTVDHRLYATGYVVRLDIGWKKRDFQRLPAWHTGPAPLTILSPLYAPFLREAVSLDSWLYRLGISKRQLNEPAAAAAEAGELRPARNGRTTADIPEAIRLAIREDLVSGAYQQAAQRGRRRRPRLGHKAKRPHSLLWSLSTTPSCWPYWLSRKVSRRRSC